MAEVLYSDFMEKFGWKQTTGMPDIYPWFTTPLLAEPDMHDPLVALHIATHLAPEALLRRIYNEQAPTAAAELFTEKNSDTLSLIDKFLRNDADHRITPTDETPEFDAAAHSGELEITDDIATGQLAEIYRKQGMDKEADEVLRKLGGNGGKKG